MSQYTNMDILVPAVDAGYSITGMCYYSFSFLTRQTDNSTYYCINSGANSQILNVNLKPGSCVMAEPGAMMYKSPDVKSTVECGSCQRCCVGETLCKGIHTNEGASEGFVVIFMTFIVSFENLFFWCHRFIGLTPDFPAKVVPVDLGQHGGKIITKGGAWMANIGDVRVSVDCDCNCCTCCCGGMGMVRQANIGTGTVFLAAGGTVLTRRLGEGEAIICDTSSLVGYEDGVKISIKRAGGCCTMCCGGEGLFNTKVKGPGLVIVQSMSFEKYKAALVPPVPSKNNDNSPA